MGRLTGVEQRFVMAILFQREKECDKIVKDRYTHILRKFHDTHDMSYTEFMLFCQLRKLLETM